jgi:4Fe-4S ferredoxin
MPLKALKNDTADALTLEWAFHIQDFKLTLDKKRCVGCQICSLACPKSAIDTIRLPKRVDGKTMKVAVDIDLAKCNFCGICDVMCPYGAIRVSIDGKHALAVVEKESFPQLIREISADANKLSDASKLEGVCPLNLIHAIQISPEETRSNNVQHLSEEKRAKPALRIDVEKEYCPCCGLCEAKLPGIMHVSKFMNGKVTIHSENCPTGCTDCLNVCPIKGTLYSSTEEGKVFINELHCTYCGACKLVCPVNEALELKRTHVYHTPIRSGAWNKALERLASPVEMTKELKTKGSSKARDSVKKMFEPAERN